jgi:lipoate-protein ligase A
MERATYKVEGGKLIKVQLREREGKIQEIRITGDFFLHPEELIEELEKALIGKPLKERDLAESIRSLIQKKEATLLGAAPEDFAKCILIAGGKIG